MICERCWGTLSIYKNFIVSFLLNNLFVQKVLFCYRRIIRSFIIFYKIYYLRSLLQQSPIFARPAMSRYNFCDYTTTTKFSIVNQLYESFELTQRIPIALINLYFCFCNGFFDKKKMFLTNHFNKNKIKYIFFQWVTKQNSIYVTYI